MSFEVGHGDLQQACMGLSPHPGALQLVWGCHAQAMRGGCSTTWTPMRLDNSAAVASAWKLDNGNEKEKKEEIWQSERDSCSFQPWIAQCFHVRHVSPRYFQPSMAQTSVFEGHVIKNDMTSTLSGSCPVIILLVFFNSFSLAKLQNNFCRLLVYTLQPWVSQT